MGGDVILIQQNIVNTSGVIPRKILIRVIIWIRMVKRQILKLISSLK